MNVATAVPAAPARSRIRVPARGVRMDAGAAGPRTAYTGASNHHPNIKLWQPTLASADAEVLRDAAKLRARARDLYRNHPYARQAVRASRLGVIGKRLRYSCRPDHRFLGIDFEEAVRWGQEFERVWETYAHGLGFYADAGRRRTFTEQMALLHKARFVDGEALATWEWAADRRWRTCLQVVDVDRLSNPNGNPESAWLKGGVELNALDEPVAYHIRNGHPNDYALHRRTDHLTWSRVERETRWGRPICAHSFEADRGGQTRGVSLFAPVILEMKMSREYAEATLASAILQSSYAAVLVSQQNYKEALEVIATLPPDQGKTVADLALENLEATIAYHEQANIRFNGASLPILYPGEDLKLLTPGHKADSLADFNSNSTRAFAAGTGTDPIAVSQDYSNVNYSSAKMAAATAWAGYAVLREELIASFAMPHVAAFLEEIVSSGGLPLPRGLSRFDFYDARDALIRGTFLTQGAPNLDPVKEAQATLMEINMGMTTLQDAVAERGEDYLEKMDQRARENIELAQRGLPPPGIPALPPAPAEDTSGDGSDGGGDETDTSDSKES